MAVTIFLDECGYTGEDLNSSEQPTFSLATLCAEEELCKTLKTEFFSKVNSLELKHVNLTRGKRNKNINMVIAFLEYIVNHNSMVEFSLFHKKYALTCKFVDIIVESACCGEEIDLYDKGQNIALANLIFMCMPVLNGTDFFNDFLEKFQKAARTGNQEDAECFFALILQHQCHDKELLGLLKSFLAKIDPKSVFPQNGIMNLDIALSAAVKLMEIWRNRKGEAFTLIHDNSSNMSKVQHIWDKIVSPTIPEILVGYDRRCMKFPIAVTKTKFEASEKWVGLQLCDVLAGALCYYAKWKINGKNISDNYGCRLEPCFEALLPKIFLMWPSTGVTPAQLGTEEKNRGSLVDYIETVITK